MSQATIESISKKSVYSIRQLNSPRTLISKAWKNTSASMIVKLILKIFGQSWQNKSCTGSKVGHSPWATFAKWFVGGKINISYNCLDRHLTT